MLLLSAFALACMLVVIIWPIGKYFDLMDRPAGRKNHCRPVLVIGGIAFVLAFELLLPWIVPVSDPYLYLMLGLGFICIAGLVDDIHQLSSKSLFLLQITAALLIVWAGGTQVETLGNLFGWGDVHIGPFAIIFTLICVLGVINAINMLDGMDGLAGFVVLVSVGWFAVLACLSGMLHIYAMLMVLVGVLMGFLMFNMRTPWLKRASIFMGNAGSLSLGLLLTWFAVELSGKSSSVVTPITAVWVIALPLMDMCRVMFGRIRQGKSPFIADHSHVHHMLSDAGFTVGQVVVIKGLFSAMLGGVGVLAWYYHVPEWMMFYAFVLVLVSYFYLTGPAWDRICNFIRNSPEGSNAN